MSRTVHALVPQPFNTLKSFLAYATGDERLTIKEAYMSFDLQLAIDKAGKLRDTLVMAKGAIAAGGDPEPILADALARLPEVANAMGHFIDPIEEPSDTDAMCAVEGHEKLEAAE